MNPLGEVVARMLASEGAILEPIHPDGLEVVAPAHVQQALRLQEWSRLGFGTDLPDQALHVTLESDWVERLAQLLKERGRYLRISINRAPDHLPDLQRIAGQEIMLANATFRLAPAQKARTHYLLLTFRITAVSDEKREDLVYLCLNESNGALTDQLVDTFWSSLRALGESPPDPCDDPWSTPWPASRVHELIARALQPRMRAELAPFLDGLERRMARDLERLHNYHSSLQAEVASRLIERSRKGENGQAEQRERLRLEAIEREYRAKVADLQRKYAMTVKVDLTQVLRISMPVYRLELLILRRKNRRKCHLDWNPLARRFDCLPCEACWSGVKTHFVCDDKLHLLCPSCLSPCAACRKSFCGACHPSGCPRCAHQAV